jgi:hypothetical protein
MTAAGLEVGIRARLVACVARAVASALRGPHRSHEELGA